MTIVYGRPRQSSTSNENELLGPRSVVSGPTRDGAISNWLKRIGIAQTDVKKAALSRLNPNR